MSVNLGTNTKHLTEETSSNIYVVHALTIPYYTDASLPSSKYNYAKLVYYTGNTYPVSQVENVTMQVCKQSDDSVLWGGAKNLTLYRTSRLKILEYNATVHNETLLPPEGLYHKIAASSYWTYVNPDFVSVGTNTVKMLFDLVDGGTNTPPTFVLDNSELYFTISDLSAITSSTLTITTTGGWFIICPEWVTLSKYWGDGNDTIDIEITDSSSDGDLQLYGLNNIAPFNCDLLMVEPSTIEVDFEDTPTVSDDTSMLYDGYKSIDMSGRAAGDVFTLTFSTEFSDEVTATARIYTSKNSTASWDLVQTHASDGTSNETVTLIDNDDIIRIRLVIEGDEIGASGTLNATLTGGTITTGTGTVSTVAPVTWEVGLGAL